MFAEGTPPRGLVLVLINSHTFLHIRVLFVYTYSLCPIYFLYIPYIGVRDWPLWDMLSWVRRGWDLDALGKFFRRRRPLFVRQIIKHNHILVMFHESNFWGIRF